MVVEETMLVVWKLERWEENEGINEPRLLHYCLWSATVELGG